MPAATATEPASQYDGAGDRSTATSRCNCRIGALIVAGDAGSGAPMPSVRCTAGAAGAALGGCVIACRGMGSAGATAAGSAGVTPVAMSGARSPSTDTVSGSL
jgi:hypothetical protein